MGLRKKAEPDPSDTGAQPDLSGGVARERRRRLQRFARNKLAVISAVFMVVLILGTFPLAPVIAPTDPNRVDLMATYRPPSPEHVLGTDSAGRDYWSRLVYGGRVALLVGVVSVVISMTIGIALGCTSGYLGGFADTIIMRITDSVMSIPNIMILLVLAAMLGPGVVNTMVVIGVLGWTGTTRLIRGQVLSVREMDFIMAANGLGVPGHRIITRHIMPNLVASITVNASLRVAGSILTEAGLSFLGLGVQMPTPTWGNMIGAAQSIQIIQTKPWIWLPPGIMVTVTVLAINFIGDGLRDALDPKMSR